MIRTHETLKTAALVSAAALVAASAALIAGPLNPPAGSVAPTYKTLNEVQPRIAIQTLPGSGQAQYVIAQSGSYYMTGGITGVANKCGIIVTANDVSIDLSGFELDGAGVGLAAISATGVSGLCVRNGVVANWISAGIYASSGSGCLFESLRCRDNGDAGVRTGPGSVVRGCAFAGGQKGVVAETGTRVVDCSSEGALAYAFWLGDGCSATQCAAYGPGAAGFYAQGNNAQIIDCTARGGLYGIQLNSGGNRVQGCKIGQAVTGISSSFANTIVGNTINSSAAGAGVGIQLLSGSHRVDSNHIYAFGQGISVAPSSTDVVLRNTMHSCTTPISGSGPVIGPIVTTAAALASNPTANIAQ